MERRKLLPDDGPALHRQGVLDLEEPLRRRPVSGEAVTEAAEVSQAAWDNLKPREPSRRKLAYDDAELERTPWGAQPAPARAGYYEVRGGNGPFPDLVERWHFNPARRVWFADTGAGATYTCDHGVFVSNKHEWRGLTAPHPGAP